MGFDPKQPRDENGEWTKSGGGKRWGRMNSTEKAALTSRATFKTKLVSPSKKSKGKAVGVGPAKVVGDTRLVSHYTSNNVEMKKGKGSFQHHSNTSISKEVRSTPKELNLFAREESSAAVAIQTAKALDRDFHTARDKANQEAMKAALAKSSVPVVKYPSTKPKAKDHPKKYMKTKR